MIKHLVLTLTCLRRFFKLEKCLRELFFLCKMNRNEIVTKYIYLSSRRSERYQEWWMNFKSRKEVKAGGNQHITEKGVHTVQGKELKGRAMNHYVCYLAKRRTLFSSRGSDPLYTSRPALRYIEKKLYQRWYPVRASFHRDANGSREGYCSL